MACTSTRPSPGSPLPEAGADLSAQVTRLQQDNHKLMRHNAALIERIESGRTQGNNP